jgi:hypothetical protein
MHVAVGEVSARRAAVCHGKEQARRSNWWIVERVKASALLESDLTTCSSLQTAGRVPYPDDWIASTSWPGGRYWWRRIMHAGSRVDACLAGVPSRHDHIRSTCMLMLCVPSVSRHPARSRHVRTVYLSADWEQLAPARPAGGGP